MEVFKPDCSSLPQSCPQPPENDAREIKCNCPTVNCKWSEWSAWSATCGPATRQRTVTTEQVSDQITLFPSLKPPGITSPSTFEGVFQYI